MNMVFTSGASRTSGLFEIGQDDTGTATTIRVSQALLDNPSLVAGRNETIQQEMVQEQLQWRNSAVPNWNFPIVRKDDRFF